MTFRRSRCSLFSFWNLSSCFCKDLRFCSDLIFCKWYFGLKFLLSVLRMVLMFTNNDVVYYFVSCFFLSSASQSMAAWNIFRSEKKTQKVKDCWGSKLEEIWLFSWSRCHIDHFWVKTYFLFDWKMTLTTSFQACQVRSQAQDCWLSIRWLLKYPNIEIFLQFCQ